jgi:hypothetical protein
MNQPMGEHLAPREADRLRRAESRWLEQARQRLRDTSRAPRSTRPDPVTSEETER